jgi:hypothetical protein
MLFEIELAIDLGRHFDALGIAWLIGGSLASSLLGRPRATDDVDLVADLRSEHVHALYQRIIDTYYVDEDAIRWAVQTRRTFNVIHLAMMIKADIYCTKHDLLAREQMERRIVLEAGGSRVPVCTAEDIILQKLLWFVEGGGVSDRQWGDLRGVVEVNRDQLDREYLDRHAREHSLEVLLAKLLSS